MSAESVILPPQNLTATVSDMNIRISWDAPTGSAPIAGYHILRRAQSESEFQHIAYISSELTTFLDTTDILPETKYIYRVRSFYESYDSTSSDARAEVTMP